MSAEPAPEHHAMPPGYFKALARGGGGPDAIELLMAAQHSKHLILLGAVADMGRRGDRPDDRLAVAGHELLARVQREDPAVAEQVICYPSIGAWALHALRPGLAIPGALPSGLAAVAAAAAIRAGIDTEIEVPVLNGTALLPSLGAAKASGSTAVVRTKTAEILSGGRRVQASPGAAGWQDLRHLRAGPLDVTIDDIDPFRMPVPDGRPAGRLTPAQVTDLAASLREALDVLPAASAAEIAAIVRVIVPYQAPEGGRFSTTSSQTFCTVAMSPQPDKYAFAETLVHETQHLKLCALLDLVRLTLPDDGSRHYAPWRTDLRPASGLLQGTYAFLGVSGFWREQLGIAPDFLDRQRAQAEFGKWREGVALVVDTLLNSGQLTAAGRDFVTEIGRVLERWQREPVPGDALTLAPPQPSGQLGQWQAENG